MDVREESFQDWGYHVTIWGTLHKKDSEKVREKTREALTPESPVLKHLKELRTIHTFLGLDLLADQGSSQIQPMEEDAIEKAGSGPLNYGYIDGFDASLKEGPILSGYKKKLDLSKWHKHIPEEILIIWKKVQECALFNRFQIWHGPKEIWCIVGIFNEKRFPVARLVKLETL